jgi:transcriptional regulator with GAF, ATPase, and Fis domain
MGQDYVQAEIIGKSDKVKEICRLIGIIAKTKSTVLVQGESGTGKEVVANAIYKHSLRNGRPFIKVNCAALSETLLESELFGHVKGSYTGALSDRKGRFELANKGTILLDEIGNMPLAGQAKLLRVLQEDEIVPVGSSKTIKVDVRVIATTNVMLKDAAQKGAFREDLYYRLSVITVFLPSLRERREDISSLVEHFIQVNSGEMETKVKGVSNEAMELLVKYDWPGNIRELKNVIENAMIIESQEIIYPETLPAHIRENYHREICTSENIQPDKKILSKDLNLRNQLLMYERVLILNALDRANWVKSRTAKLLGIDRRNLGYFMKKHHILMPTDRENHTDA